MAIEELTEIHDRFSELVRIGDDVWYQMPYTPADGYIWCRSQVIGIRRNLRVDQVVLAVSDQPERPRYLFLTEIQKRNPFD